MILQNELYSRIFKNFSIHKYASSIKIVTTLLIPTITLYGIFLYKNEMNYYHLFRVGKDSLYFNKYQNTKLYTSLVLTTIIVVAYLSVAIIFYIIYPDLSFISAQRQPFYLFNNYEIGTVELFILQKPLLSFMIDFIMSVGLPTFFMCYFNITIYQFIKRVDLSIIISLFVFTFGSSLLYKILPSIFVFSNAIFYSESTLGGNFKVIYFFTPYIIPIIILLLVKVVDKNEIF